MLPWFLAMGRASLSGAAAGRIGWWLAHSLILAGAMFLALQMSPSLGFLLIILPLFPVVLGLHMLASGPYRGQWPFVISGALFLSWMLLAVFPIQ